VHLAPFLDLLDRPRHRRRSRSSTAARKAVAVPGQQLPVVGLPWEARCKRLRLLARRAYAQSRHFFPFVNHDGATSDDERQTIIDGCRYERKPHASARRCACPLLSCSSSRTYRLSHINLACCPRNLGSASDGGRAPKSSEDLAGQRGHLGHRR
jgi:hypothetical protein